ncbi:MAG: hypothetical protein FJY85_06860 [Deltaproteobacteria bacterium]|nr:hypothetical protein [Deltaproteobacteria bacterium]
MGATTQRVNAKRFLQDYRAGKTDEELMEAYGLSRKTLEKLLKKLVDENLLDSSEVRSERPFPATVALKPEPMARRPQRPAAAKPDSSSTCPQCGASVTVSMLICPECGHVLPGEERWARVEPKKGLLDRIPPKVLGSLLAIPAAVALFFVFKDIIIPMTDATIEKQAETARKKGHSQGADRFPRRQQPEQRQSLRTVEKRVRQLIADDILAGANADFTVLSAGLRWWDITEEERVECMEAIRSAMAEAGEAFQINVVDSEGKILARGTETSLSLTAPPRRR